MIYASLLLTLPRLANCDPDVMARKEMGVGARHNPYEHVVLFVSSIGSGQSNPPTLNLK